MANPFLNMIPRDVETALLLERAVVSDIGKAVAYTNGTKIYLNTDENLEKILPAYDPILMKKWLLRHEEMHILLKHHDRFFKYLDKLKKLGLSDKDIDELERVSIAEKHIDKVATSFNLTKEEVNIIMDILVHDSLSKMFPELVETAVANLAQMRNRNSLSYTFKTFTLEEMLDEYKAHKKGEDGGEGKDDSKEDGEDESKAHKKGHAEGGKGDSKDDDKSTPEESEGEDKEEAPKEETPQDEHDKTDWSKLKDIDQEEFIDESKADGIDRAVAKLKRKKLKFARLTETLNGLVTTTRRRTYAMPSPIHTGGGVLLKGSTPGKAQLYLIFDASGSMSNEMEMFQEIISKSIPQAMDVPCEWFAGWGAKIPSYKEGESDDYYKGKFQDFMGVNAYSGYADDGDRTIELCWKAEQQGYSPIGVTDGGGKVSWSEDKLKQLKRTIFVVPSYETSWIRTVKRINPRIQVLEV